MNTFLAVFRTIFKMLSTLALWAFCGWLLVIMALLTGRTPKFGYNRRYKTWRH